jgi:hypothetical protein
VPKLGDGKDLVRGMRPNQKLMRVTERQKGNSIRGFDVTLYPGDYQKKMCTTEPKCMKREGHDGEHWPRGKFGEASDASDANEVSRGVSLPED